MQRDAPLRVGEAVGRLAIAYIVKAWPRLSETFILNEIVGMAHVNILGVRRDRIGQTGDARREQRHQRR